MRPTLLVCALLTAGCARSAPVAPVLSPAILNIVVGSWTLTQGCGGVAYRCSGAGSLTVPNLVVFYSNGTMDQFRAGVKVASGTFSITPSAADSLRSGTLVMAPGLEAATDTLTLNFSIEGELMLAEPCCDRLTYSFFKANAPD
ncbi:MAG: hypothetical protein ACREN6_13660 [Gemmatimonadaceae bacterium]